MKLSPPLFRRAKLSLVNLNLLVYEALRVFHLLAIATVEFSAKTVSSACTTFFAPPGSISIGDRHQVLPFAA